VVYMAEGTTDAGLGGSAVIESMGMKSTGQFQLPFQRLGAAGNVGTGVAASAGTAYLTTGENGGTYQFAMSNGVLTRVSTGLNRSLRDARAVGMAGGAVVATSGSSGGAASMTWYLGGTPVALPLTGVIDAGAKGDIFIDPSLSSYAITTMGSGGIAGLLTGSANIFATLALPTAPAGSGISPIDIRANGVTGAGGYVFVAYGGLGIGIVATPTSTGFASGAAILSSIGAFQFTPAVSANGIGATPPNTANQGAIFVATQTGLKVLQYTLPATRCQTNPDGKKKKNEETCTDD
jgi:hypothetical protein